jgi:maltose alpha-D-glucosyltransferase/alpha-amylase
MVNLAFGRDRYAQLRRLLPAQLPAFLVQQRWFGAKARQIRATHVADVIPVAGGSALLLIVRVSYATGGDEVYAVPVTQAAESDSNVLTVQAADGGSPVVLKDALSDTLFLSALLDFVHGESSVEGEHGVLRGRRTSAYSALAPSTPASLAPKALRAEQSNTSVVYGDRLILKLFRRLEEGINPDLEVGTFLTEVAHFKSIPQLAGSLEYQSRDGKVMVQGILQAFVANQGDAWRHTLASLDDFYGDIQKHFAGASEIAVADDQSASAADFAGRSLNSYSNSAKLLGRRTAEMHLALSTDSRNLAFDPEPFTSEFQVALERSLAELTGRVFELLREKKTSLPAGPREKADALSEKEPEILARFRSALSHPIHAVRTRIHGDYHLGQVLFTGSDFVIIDFEGEPARPLFERRLKRSPLQDVAGMLRSFHYAAFSPLLGADAMSPQDVARLSPWADFWNARISAVFLDSYFETCGHATFLPKDPSELQSVLNLHLMEKAVYELGYELNNRPGWVGIPLQGIWKLLSS